MSEKLYKRLKFIPIIIIIVSVFIIGANLIISNKYVFSRNDVSFSASESHYKKPKNDFLIDINTATTKELSKLPGVGEETAKKIIELRFDMGGFEETKELMLISGINESKYKLMLPYVTVDKVLK